MAVVEGTVLGVGEAPISSGRTGVGTRRVLTTAALALIALLALVASGPNMSSETRNQRFDAATSSGKLQTMDYVLELRFADGISVDERKLIIAGLGGSNAVMSSDQTHYKIVVRLPPKSLQELEQYAAEVQSRREILSAEIVALQLPVR